ncbi:bifunctional oligoribonuclease/PAP phosphatase NrnA [[Clostridium] symbiosum]|uniref:DHH family phosphoesterase n=1 Tax=Clostridium symbiosum TaxID=1512 RepID=UPI001D082F39|nr:bifunctional oligoribonuclease/PAP phosphatase NrnA [[Clostridium] symbiosum]MCB6609535.1 bifunctional oligoribonuclease/PAP phosphatase NrnA [[Clostridium] symbiosum]MCB6931479.1 bifunctional oligoribonuclease/PAP phosphatase NrnA [[Clostridium] symbiosum]
MSNLLNEVLDGVNSVVLLGHLHPDGDCVGTCLGIYNYLSENYPQLTVELFLDHPAAKFSYLKNFDQIKTEWEDGRAYELCITMDSSDTERLGVFLPYFETAGKTFCIDHHVTNVGFAEKNHIISTASSSSEVLFGLLAEDRISKETAECLYTGIVHDTGVFKYSNTSKKTMEIAGKLVDKGLNSAKIIDDSFYRKTYVQNQVLGRALLESFLFMDGRCIFTALKQRDLDFYGADSNDLDGIIDQLRITEGVECAVFIYEKEPHVYKVSMRSNDYVDVSRIASYFGGGGHVRAAGCTISGSAYDVLNNLSKHIEQQMKEHEDK